jgi:hypothetical protein
MQLTSSLGVFVSQGDFRWVMWGVLALLLIAIIMRRRSRKNKEAKAKGAAGGRYAG